MSNCEECGSILVYAKCNRCVGEKVIEQAQQNMLAEFRTEILACLDQLEEYSENELVISKYGRYNIKELKKKYGVKYE